MNINTRPHQKGPSVGSETDESAELPEFVEFGHSGGGATYGSCDSIPEDPSSLPVAGVDKARGSSCTCCGAVTVEHGGSDAPAPSRGSGATDLQKGAGIGGLGNHADYRSSPSTDRIKHPRNKRQSGRADRYALREIVWQITSLQRPHNCGRTRVDSQSGYTMNAYDRGGEIAASWGNVQTCGSKWFCPVCAAKERQERAEQLAELASRHLAEGGGLLMFTPTIRHHNGQSLRELVESVQYAWTGRVANGGAWVSDRKRYGIQYIHRSMDLTIGPNGWHPHPHILMFTERLLDSEERAHLRQRLWKRFKRGVEAEGCEPPSLSQCPLEPAMSGEEIGRYVSTAVMKEKGRSAAMESVRHDMKNGRKRSDGHVHFSPFEILRIMHDWGIDEEEQFGGVTRKLRDVWLEYENAMSGEGERQGVHAFDSSPGLWQHLDDLRELQGEEIGDEEEEAPLWVVEVDIWTMDEIIRERGALARAQTAAEVGRAAFEAFLDVYRTRADRRFDSNSVDLAIRTDGRPLVAV